MGLQVVVVVPVVVAGAGEPKAVEGVGTTTMAMTMMMVMTTATRGGARAEAGTWQCPSQNQRRRAVMRGRPGGEREAAKEAAPRRGLGRRPAPTPPT
jgi:hypothetical protein